MSARSIFADLLHAYRGATTQQEAAQELRVSKSLYQKIESGDRRPQRDFAERCDELYKTPGVFVRIYEDTVSEPYSAWFGPRVVYEDREAGRVVEDPKEVAAISTALSMIKSCALSPTDTRQLLGEIRG